jgi:hypothetical protein
MPTAYVIRADRPFPGYVQTIVNDDGTVGHDRHPSIEAYAASLPFPVRAVTWEELEPMVNAFHDWFCRIGDRHFTFVDCIRRPSGEIAAKAAAAL